MEFANAVLCVKSAVVIWLGNELWRVLRAFRRRETVTGRHVLITGGSEGIGLEVCKICVGKGAKVSIISRTPAKLEAAKAEILRATPDASVEVYPADVGNRAAVAAAVQQSELKFGPPDICIAAAGLCIAKYFEDLTDEDFMVQLRTNFLGVVNIAKEVVPGMAKRNAGHFCALSSAAASVPFIGYAAYAPSKAAVRNFMDTLRNEFADTSVQFHVACPPDTDTPGLKDECKDKPSDCSIWPQWANETFPATSVAELIVNDLLAGEYCLRSPDTFGHYLVSAGWGFYPRSRPVLEAVLGPFFAGFHVFMVWWADRSVRLHGHHRR